MLIGFSILLYLAYRVGVDAPSIPARVTGTDSDILLLGPVLLLIVLVGTRRLNRIGASSGLSIQGKRSQDYP